MSRSYSSISVPETRQSAPLDLSSPLSIDATFVRGKTILITGGASGFGAGFFARWASQGAAVIIGDINVAAGTALVARVKQETRNEHLHFLPLDVASWSSQVWFFQEAAKLSPHGGVDAVVANAGVNVVAEARAFEVPTVDYQNDPDPPPPPLTTIDVNLTGTLYTAHLSLFYLPRNPDSVPCSPNSNPSTMTRDRHLLLLGSMASLYPIISQPPYCVSKHGVLGLFRSLRASAPVTSGIRVNMLCPYFIDTPLIGAAGRAALAGIPLGTIDDVVQAATYFVADPSSVGRALVVGPRLKIRSPKYQATGGARGVPDVQDIYEISAVPGDGVKEVALWECYAHDLDDTEVFCRRMVRLLNAAALARGWLGIIYDLLAIVIRVIAQRWSGPYKEKKK
jgi:NAD(P)-dependent dehydrogenase (short-subunit alcohol dehydrogenase family)